MRMARILFAAALGAMACGGGATRPGARSPSGTPVAADPAITVDCAAACARLRECGKATPSCEADCGGVKDDAGRSRWGCWSSSQTCGEIEECDATGE